MVTIGEAHATGALILRRKGAIRQMTVLNCRSYWLEEPMSETTNWTGLASGARTGTMTVEIARDGTRMTGTLRLLDPGVGELHSRFTGRWTTDNKLSADTLEHFASNPGGAVTLPQTGKMEGTFNPRQNVITGHWKTEVDPLGAFRWIQVPGSRPKPAGAFVAVSMQFARGWERCAAGTKTLFEKSGITWNPRYSRWLKVALQFALVGLIGYVVIAFVVDFLFAG